MTSATIHIDGITYDANIDVSRYPYAVSIFANGQLAGKGGWHSTCQTIDGCSADLGDNVYAALDAAIIVALAALERA